jgi:hypothetical protein
MGHDPQPRVGQASDQAIKVRTGSTSPVTQCGQIPAKAPARGQAIHESRTTRQTTPTLPGQPQASHLNTYRRFRLILDTPRLSWQ